MRFTTATVLAFSWATGGILLVVLGAHLGHTHLPWVGFALTGLVIAIAYSVTIQDRAGMKDVQELEHWGDPGMTPDQVVKSASKDHA